MWSGSRPLPQTAETHTISSDGPPFGQPVRTVPQGASAALAPIPVTIHFTDRNTCN